MVLKIARVYFSKNRNNLLGKLDLSNNNSFYQFILDLKMIFAYVNKDTNEKF